MIDALKIMATVAASTWSLAISFAVIVRIVHEISGNRRLENVWRSLARLHQELWLFAPPGLLAVLAENCGSGHWGVATLNVLTIGSWWYYRNWPEDNHWKRRAKKAKEAVERRAGRLVVVPAVSPS